MSTVRDYFAREAGDYLDGLDRIVDGLDRGAVAPAELHRVSRALRGSAQMAREDSIAQVATALEGVARVVAEGHVRWTPDLAGRVRDTARDIRSLLAGDAAAPAIVSSAVSRLAGIAAAPARPAPAAPSTADEQFRGFAARESAAVLATVESALQAVAVNPMDREPLKAVLRRQRALMGAARLPSIPVLAETLTAVDEVTRLVARLDVAVKDEWLDAYRCAHDVLAALVGALQQGTEPAPGNALPRLRTLRRELMERHGGEEPMRQPPVLTPEDAAAAPAPAPPVHTVPPRAARPAAPAVPRAGAAPGAPPPTPPRPAAAPAAAPVAAKPAATAPAAGRPAAPPPAPQRPAAVPVGAAAPPAPNGAPPAGAAGEVRPVEDFLYRGDRALARALELRVAVQQAVAAGDPRAWEELMAEVFDLIALSRS